MYFETKRIVRKFIQTSKNGKKFEVPHTSTFAFFQCDNCYNKFERQVGREIDKSRCNNSVNHYCSDCPYSSLAGQKGKVNHRKLLNEKIGQRSITNHGYVAVYVGTSHPSRSVRSGSIFEHILVMENHLNRELQKGEVVHHIDGNKQNNTIDNLDLLTVQEHNNCHGKSEQIIFDLVKQGKVNYNRRTKLYELVDITSPI